jgi:hypothetical protein
MALSKWGSSFIQTTFARQYPAPAVNELMSRRRGA